MVAQLQSQITTHLEGLFSATEAQHPSTTVVHSSVLVRRLKQEGQKPPFTAAVREEGRKSPSFHPNASKCCFHPPPKSKARQQLGLPSYPCTKGWALMKVTAQEDSEAICTASAQKHSLLPTASRLPLFTCTPAAPGAKHRDSASILDACSLPAEVLWPLQPVLQWVSALPGSRGQAVPSTSALRTIPAPQKPIQIFLSKHKELWGGLFTEMKKMGIFLFYSWCWKIESHWVSFLDLGERVVKFRN